MTRSSPVVKLLRRSNLEWYRGWESNPHVRRQGILSPKTCRNHCRSRSDLSRSQQFSGTSHATKTPGLTGGDNSSGSVRGQSVNVIRLLPVDQTRAPLDPFDPRSVVDHRICQANLRSLHSKSVRTPAATFAGNTLLVFPVLIRSSDLLRAFIAMQRKFVVSRKLPRSNRTQACAPGNAAYGSMRPTHVRLQLYRRMPRPPCRTNFAGGRQPTTLVLFARSLLPSPALSRTAGTIPVGNLVRTGSAKRMNAPIP